jgi:hypothetical protein
MAVSKVVKEPETLRGERDSMNKSNLDVQDILAAKKILLGGAMCPS